MRLALSASPAESRLKRLFWLRNVSIAGQAAAVLVAQVVFAVELPLAVLAASIGILALINIVTAIRLGQTAEVSDQEVFLQLCADVALLTASLYFTGGATNPFVSLYLLPLMIAATVLPARYTWAMAGMTAAVYSMLMFWYQPLGQDHAHHSSEFGLHVLGMWFNFLVSAMLIALFVARMAASIRARDRLLSAARERTLRDEQLVTLGTFAAGAAHELGTPLSTIAVLVREMERDSGGNHSLRADMALLRGQVEQCKRILTDLVGRAGKTRAEGARLRSLDALLQEAVDRWKLLRPEARLRVSYSGTGQVPRIVAEETVTQALVNLLNNAADASPGDIEVECSWVAGSITLEIRDRGPGVTVEAMNLAGRTAFSDKQGRGLGLGLLLANATIERIGGSVTLANREGGGGITQVMLPITALTVPQPG
ncbi:MAG: HAMP domain-containing histidine kinase [Prolixibacteraceae bacterium]|nr:HAMP domain-containing histidine kinase [Burkholderiales bacterium]